MKALLREYFASLKERGELDAILPDMLAELGFEIISRPQRGTSQRGVDIAAVGIDPDDNVRKLILFTIKKGDLTRGEWSAAPQGVRASLDEIQDTYLHSRVAERHRQLAVLVVVVVGGVMQEQVMEGWAGYVRRHTTARLGFACWTGDTLADQLLRGLLREEILPRELRADFQKAVAMVDVPEVSFEHFKRLVRALLTAAQGSPEDRVRAARQINICLWILYVWARDAGNVEAAYQSGEYALLAVWEMAKDHLVGSGGRRRELLSAVNQVMNLHLNILEHLVDEKFVPHVSVIHGLTMAVGTREYVDLNLALHEILGRVALAGLWRVWLSRMATVMEDQAMPATNGAAGAQQSPADSAGAAGNESVSDEEEGAEGTSLEISSEEHTMRAVTLATAVFRLIDANPVLLLPATDDQGTVIALVLLLWLHAGQAPEDVHCWLSQMVDRLDFAVRTRNRYPCATIDYDDLVDHASKDEEHFKRMTSGSSVIPLVAAWITALGMQETYDQLARLVADKLSHCALQLWLPDCQSEVHLYLDRESHGRALATLSLAHGGAELVSTIEKACEHEKGFDSLSAVMRNQWPIVLVACRHYKLPVPPQFWISSLAPPLAEGDGEPQ